MKRAIATLKGVTPYSPSRHYMAEVEKLKDESHDQYDERTWRHHAHVNQNGYIIIPGVAFSWAIKAMASRRGDRIPGKGQKTYTKPFQAIEVLGDINTNVKLDAVGMESFMANADGKRGGQKRVLRRFPILRGAPSWEGELTFIMWDDGVVRPVFEETLKDTGLLIGVGRRRPENSGFFGRFAVTNIDWHDRVDVSLEGLGLAS